MSHSSTINSEPDEMLAVRDGLVVAPDTFSGTFSTIWAAGIVLFFITLTLGTGIADAIWLRPSPKLVGAEARELEAKRKNAHFADGSLARLIEDEWRLRSYVRGTVGPFYAFHFYRLLGEGSETLTVGKDGWLFLKNRAIPRSGSDQSIGAVAAARMAVMQRRFASRNSRLVAVPIPRKSVVVPQFLPRGSNPRPGVDRAILAEAKKRDVECVDLLTPFTTPGIDPVYYQWDSHWNHEGQRLAALETCRQSGVLVDEKARPFQLYKLPERNPVCHGLLDTNGISDAYSQDEYFLSQTEQFHEVIAQTGPEKRWWILDRKKKGLRRVVCGTSFTAGRRFWQYVSYYGGEQVEDASFPGVYPDAVLLKFLKKRGQDLPELVFWEIPNHNLTQDRGVKFDVYQNSYRELKPKTTWPLPLATDLRSRKLKSPKAKIKKNWQLVAVWTKDAVKHAGCGTVLVRLEGIGKNVGVRLRMGKIRILYKNLNLYRKKPIIFPIITDGTPGKIDVSVRCESGAQTDFELIDVSLCADLDESRSAVAVPGKVIQLPSGERRQEFTFETDAPRGPVSLVFNRDSSAPKQELRILGVGDQVLRSVTYEGGKKSGEVVVDLPWLGAPVITSIQVIWRDSETNGISSMKRAPVAP